MTEDHVQAGPSIPSTEAGVSKPKHMLQTKQAPNIPPCRKKAPGTCQGGPVITSCPLQGPPGWEGNKQSEPFLLAESLLEPPRQKSILDYITTSGIEKNDSPI